MAEFWDLYDRDQNPLGKTLERNGDTIPEQGEFHFVVNILSINKDGKILITKRHPDKTYGNLWEITGGSVLEGEDPIHGAIRELYEETGLKADISELKYMGQIIRERSGCIHNFYIYNGDFNSADIVLQDNETVSFRLVFPEEIAKMSNDGLFLDFQFNRMRAIYGDLFFKRK